MSGPEFNIDNKVDWSKLESKLDWYRSFATSLRIEPLGTIRDAMPAVVLRPHYGQIARNREVAPAKIEEPAVVKEKDGVGVKVFGRDSSTEQLLLDLLPRPSNTTIEPISLFLSRGLRAAISCKFQNSLWTAFLVELEPGIREWCAGRLMEDDRVEKCQGAAAIGYSPVKRKKVALATPRLLLASSHVAGVLNHYGSVVVLAKPLESLDDRVYLSPFGGKYVCTASYAYIDDRATRSLPEAADRFTMSVLGLNQDYHKEWTGGLETVEDWALATKNGLNPTTLKLHPTGTAREILMSWMPKQLTAQPGKIDLVQTIVDLKP